MKQRLQAEFITEHELKTLSDDELVKVIMERAGMDESRARESLSIIRGGPPDGVTY